MQLDNRPRAKLKHKHLALVFWARSSKTNKVRKWPTRVWMIWTRSSFQSSQNPWSNLCSFTWLHHLLKETILILPCKTTGISLGMADVRRKLEEAVCSPSSELRGHWLQTGRICLRSCRYLTVYTNHKFPKANESRKKWQTEIAQESGDVDRTIALSERNLEDAMDIAY